MCWLGLEPALFLPYQTFNFKTNFSLTNQPRSSYEKFNLICNRSFDLLLIHWM